MRKRSFFLSPLLLALLAAVPLLAAPPDKGNSPKTVTLMTRNLYLGADLAPAIFAVATGGDVVGAVSEVWASVRFTDFPARAAGLAREIAAAQPDLIGLQEAELWRSQTPALFSGNASHVEYDFVQILLDALAARGLHYGVVAVETGIDVELPGFLSESATELSDIRLTERDAILARTDLKTSELKLSNAQTGHFVTNIEFEAPGFGTVTVLRGWASVDAKVRGKSFRFISTHLEADSEDVRVAQALEIIAGPADTTLPVVFVGDSNSNANGDATSAAYFAFLGAGFTDAWLEAHPGSAVSSCCNAPLLDNPLFPLSTDDEGRIDLLLYRAASDFHTLGASLFGTHPADRVSNGLTLIWPSDHAGVAATLQIHN